MRQRHRGPPQENLSRVWSSFLSGVDRALSRSVSVSKVPDAQEPFLVGLPYRAHSCSAEPAALGLPRGFVKDALMSRGDTLASFRSCRAILSLIG